jgi:Zn-dependent peptidase ImmA (M78 family)
MNGEAHIYVNVGQALTRQRFTVAHEIGHLILHEPGRAFRDTWSSTDTNIAEVQANNFAANLLMPSWMVNALASGGTYVESLADKFRVSPEAMRYRLQNLGYRIT